MGKLGYLYSRLRGFAAVLVAVALSVANLQPAEAVAPLGSSSLLRQTQTQNLPGIDGSNPAQGSRYLPSTVVLNDKVYYIASTDATGPELFTSDGTAAGTYLVKETVAGAGSGIYPYNTKITVSNGKMYFWASYEAWVSDGTAAGTGMLKKLSTRMQSQPTQFTKVGTKTFFVAYDSSGYYADAPAGQELWVTDGTSAGTSLVKDIYPGYWMSGSTPINNNSGIQYITECNGKAFFSATDGVNGYELWSSDGTTAGTNIVKDIMSGANSSSPSNLACVNNLLVFSASNSTNGYEPWVSDGTSAGTVMLRDIYTGASASSPGSMTAVGGKAYFSANDGTNGVELWSTDGTSAGTVLVKNINAGAANSSPTGFTGMGGKVYFTATDSRGGELWVTDGTTVGTLLVSDINQTAPGASSTPKDMYAWNGNLYFDADNGVIGREFWKSDGTNSGTVLIKDMFPGISDMLDTSNNAANVPYFAGTSAGLFFTANSPVYAQEMWISDGTTAGTRIVVDAKSGPGSSYARNAVAFNGKIFFSASSAYYGQELWTTDLSTNTQQMIDIYPGAPSGMKTDNQHNMVVFNNKLFFSARNTTNGYELWTTDGTVDGTSQLVDIYAGNSGTNAANFSGPRFLTVCNNKLFFNGFSNGGYELYVSDGTAAGTVIVKDLSISTGSDPQNLTCMNNTLYFTADDSYYWQSISGTVGRELYKTDGTSAGTTLISDINTSAMTFGYGYSGTNGSNPSYLTVVNNKLYFSATNTTNENELYYTDGTTVTKIDVYPGASSSSPVYLVNYNNNLYFRATTTAAGLDMHKLDGTTQAITAVDVSPGSASFNFNQPVVMGGLLWFAANGEMYTSDGTAANTGIFEDLLPGGNSNPDWLVSLGSVIMYLTYDSVLGSQPRYIVGNAIYTISFNGNSSTSGTAPADISVMSVSATVPGNTGNLTRTGYRFIGWNTSPTGVGTSYLPGATITPIVDTPLFAQWATNVTYTVTYNANGATSGVVAPAVTNVDYAFYLDTNSGNLVKPGYSFGGWNTLANGTGTNYASGARYTPTADVTLYAKWNALPAFTITFNGNGITSGTAPASLTNVYSTATLPGVGTMVKSGSTFAGWNTAADGLGIAYAAGETLTPQANLTLYAQWTSIAISTLTYDANGATSGSVPAAATAAATYVVIDSNTGSLAKTGYVFSGWNSAADGSGTNYTGGNNFLLNANTTFYAKWILANYTVTYSANGATGGTAPSAATGVSISTTVPANSGSLVKAGYTFVGWNTLASGLGTDYAAGSTFYPTSSTTLYAKWTALPTYTITYSGNGSTGGGVPVAQSGIYASTTLDNNSGALVRAGYFFGGWNTAADGSGTTYSAGSTYTPSANITLYAFWSAIPTYTLTYDGNLKTGGVTPAVQTGITSTATVAGNTGSLVRLGYRFDGWNTAANGSGTAYIAGDSISLSADTTLYAVWVSVPTFTLTYSGNGQTTGSVPLAVTTSNSSIVLSDNINVMTKTNYTFTGWNTAANGTGTHYAVGASFPISANTTLYAEWTPQPYTITYNGNGNTSGSVPAATTAAGTQVVSANTGGLALGGYAFSGWNTAADGSGTNYAAGSNITPTANTTLFAKWVNYTITYSGNGNDSGSVPAAVTVTSAFTLPGASGMGKTGYNFNGWNTAANGAGTAYAGGATYTPTANVTLYAVWAVLPVYTITYNSNGATSGTAPSAQSSVATTLNLAINTGALDKSGYVFDGWNTLANGTGISYAENASYSLSSSVTLYAKWTPLYTITYNSNGATSGSVPASQAALASTLNLATNSGNLAKTGFVFDGWNTAANGTGTSYAVGAGYTLSSSVTLYAKWVTLYTITYDANGATSGTTPAAYTSVAGTTTISANSGNLAKTGYLFAGWNTAANGNGTDVSESATYSLNASVTLFAKWVQLLSITFDGNGATTGSSPIFANSVAQTVVLPGNDGSYARPGYYFTGWNTAANGLGTTYAAGSNFALSSNSTLYAIWTASVRTITFDLNGVTSGTAPAAITLAPGTVNLPFGSTTWLKNGYNFVGWNTAANGSGNSYAAGGSFPLSADITLYAEWALKKVYPIGASWISRNVLPLSGGQITITGFGFDKVSTVMLSGVGVQIASQSTDRIVLNMPSMPAGVYKLTFIGEGAALDYQTGIQYQADRTVQLANFLSTKSITLTQLRSLDSVVASVKNFNVVSLSVITRSASQRAVKGNVAKIAQLLALAQRIKSVYGSAVNINLSFDATAAITGIVVTFGQNG